MYYHSLWVGPVTALVIVVYLWYKVGPAVMAALAVMILMMPVQFLVAKLFSRLR